MVFERSTEVIFERIGTGRTLAIASLAIAACASDDGAVERQARKALERSLTGETAAVQSRYDGRARLLWVDADGLNRRGERIVKTVRSVWQDGLDADAYGVSDALDALDRAQDSEATPHDRGVALAEADLAITRGYAHLVRDLRLGTTKPSVVQPAWRIQPFDSVGESDLVALVADDPEDALETARPATAEYARLGALRAALEEIRAAGGWPSVPSRKLERGDDDPAVAALRARLLASVVPEERDAALAGIGRNTQFDEGLDRALRSFQERHALDPDGITGDRTIAALNVSVEHRIRTVEINQERWRWLPHRFGERVILVNVAGYEVNLLENDRTVLRMNAVVGKPDASTPIFADTMTHMIVNPYWNVPESITTDELLPSARDNAGYLSAHNYEVVSLDGDVADADAVNDDDFLSNYRIRQRPGTGNALGRVKFMFPNQNAVYLHDTPSKSLFARPVRAFSHGCVRVAEPEKLAQFLIEWTGGDQAQVDDAFASDETKQIDLPHAVPVYLAYLTAWVGDDERPRFYPDVYDLDAEMIDLLMTSPGTRVAATGSRVRNAGGG